MPDKHKKLIEDLEKDISTTTGNMQDDDLDEISNIFNNALNKAFFVLVILKSSFLVIISP